MIKLNKNHIKKLRNILVKELEEYKGKEHIKLDISSDILEQILFETRSDGERVFWFGSF